MVAAYYMEVGGLVVAGWLGCRGYRHEKFHVVPKITALVEFKMTKEAARAVEYPLSSASRLSEEFSWSTICQKWRP